MARNAIKPAASGGAPSTRLVRPTGRRRGSVLIIVMITLLFAATALIAFMDKATNDLAVDHRAIIARDLRVEAYSALETTLAVLNDFSLADNGLHSPAEGWTDPLGFAGYTPSEGRTVDVAFEDESGKISLPHATADTLSRLFQSWNVAQPDADALADALMGWMQHEHVYSTSITPDYDQSATPYDPPGRPLRSYSELAAIDKVRDFFYDANGRPNDYYLRFVAAVSLYDFSKSNINGATTDTLTALGQYDPTQQGQLSDYLNGKNKFQNQGPGYFQDPNQAQSIAGPGGNITAFGTTISALRITITVHDGNSQFKLSAVIAPLSGGAKPVTQTATSASPKTSTSTAQSVSQAQSAPNTNQANATSTRAGQTATSQNLQYPFKLLEISENDEIPPPPPPPPENGTS